MSYPSLKAKTQNQPQITKNNTSLHESKSTPYKAKTWKWSPGKREPIPCPALVPLALTKQLYDLDSETQASAADAEGPGGYVRNIVQAGEAMLDDAIGGCRGNA